MATITTSTAPTAILKTWDVPPATVSNPRLEGTAVPRGELVFPFVESVPLKLTTDTSRWLLTVTLPRNFVYILSHFDLQVSGAQATLDDFERGMPVTVLGDPSLPELIYEDFFSMTLFDESVRGYEYNETGAVQASFRPWNFPTRPIPCVDGPGTIQVAYYVNNTANATAALLIQGKVIVLIYTIEQWRRAPLHTPNLIRGSNASF